MKVYQYWARGEGEIPGERWSMVCFGGSDEGPEEALAEARRRAAEAGRRYAESQLEKYPYADRPLREELKGRYEEEGRLIAAVTRNAAGSLVLNTSRVMFLDFDYPRPGVWGFLKRLFGAAGGLEEELRQRLAERVRNMQGFGMRLYRTANGLRGLVTSRLYDPVDPGTLQLLAEFGCDPLYTRLCRTQECFRARLTPKFWRCGLRRPPTRFPWADGAQEEEYRRWEGEYNRTAAQYATCHFLGTLGEGRTDPEAERVVAIHDAVACTPSENLA